MEDFFFGAEWGFAALLFSTLSSQPSLSVFKIYVANPSLPPGCPLHTFFFCCCFPLIFSNKFDGPRCGDTCPPALMALRLCPCKTQLVECRQPCANNNGPVSETLLAPGSPDNTGQLTLAPRRRHRLA
ncbi:hypothetical protein TcCL_NonESM02170 [Trypanosoma cruzi]|nr:hypothetical protein TcCL_NonESM02170 [Trypanosoma cruzi]